MVTHAATHNGECDCAAACVATMDATRTAAVGAIGCATTDDAAAVNRTRAAAWHTAGAEVDEHHDTIKIVWPGDPILAHLLMGRDEF